MSATPDEVCFSQQEPPRFRDAMARDLDSEAPKGAITRAHLAEAIQKRSGLSRPDAAKFVEALLSEIFHSIVTGESVKLSGFGVFQVRAKRERLGRNPKTGVDAPISARLVVSFRPSAVLRARINNGLKTK